MNKKIRVIIAFSALFICLTLSFSGHMERVINVTYATVLNEKNDHFLQVSFEKSMELFIVLSAIKSGLAILEGSEVGIGFSLEIGDGFYPFSKCGLIGALLLNDSAIYSNESGFLYLCVRTQN